MVPTFYRHRIVAMSELRLGEQEVRPRRLLLVVLHLFDQLLVPRLVVRDRGVAEDQEGIAVLRRRDLGLLKLLFARLVRDQPLNCLADAAAFGGFTRPE